MKLWQEFLNQNDRFRTSNELFWHAKKRALADFNFGKLVVIKLVMVDWQELSTWKQCEHKIRDQISFLR